MLQPQERGYVGLRVIRGQKWTADKVGGGAGYCGTLIWSNEDRSRIRIMWDNGDDCTIAYPGQHHPVCIDIVQLGVLHAGKCSVCRRSLRGFKWQCTTCDKKDKHGKLLAIFLCNTCYHSDQHSINHNFIRFDSATHNGIKVGQRAGSEKIRVRGIFPSAVVAKRCEGSIYAPIKAEKVVRLTGRVETVVNMAPTYCTVAIVRWQQMPEPVAHSLGKDSKVDIYFKEPTSGDKYYWHHLPAPWELTAGRSDTVVKANVTSRPGELALAVNDKVDHVVSVEPGILAGVCNGIHGKFPRECLQAPSGSKISEDKKNLQKVVDITQPVTPINANELQYESVILVSNNLGATPAKHVTPPPRERKSNPGIPINASRAVHRQHPAPPPVDRQLPAPPEVDRQHPAPPEVHRQHPAPPEVDRQHPAPPEVYRQHPAPPEVHRHPLQPAPRRTASVAGNINRAQAPPVEPRDVAQFRKSNPLPMTTGDHQVNRKPSSRVLLPGRESSESDCSSEEEFFSGGSFMSEISSASSGYLHPASIWTRDSGIDTNFRSEEVPYSVDGASGSALDPVLYENSMIPPRPPRRPAPEVDTKPTVTKSDSTAKPRKSTRKSLSSQRPDKAKSIDLLANRRKQMIAMAGYSYEGDLPDDLSFLAGDLITHVIDTGENWIWGQKAGRSGWIPRNYVTTMELDEDDEDKDRSKENASSMTRM